MSKNTSTNALGASSSTDAKTIFTIETQRLSRPEWVRIAEAIRLFGIGRSSLYELLAEGRIKSASVRKRGNVRGIRLISTESLSLYIEGLTDKHSK